MDNREPLVVRGRVSVPRPDGVHRSRLVEPLAQLTAGRTGLVVAPAGAGKTTLLAHVAAASEAPVAWLSLDDRSGTVRAFLSHLEAALQPVVPGLTGGWTTVDEAVAELDEALDHPVLVVLDDVHALGDQAAAGALASLIDQVPASVRLLLSSRRPAGTELHRRRLDGAVVELDADALRFRTWEVEELFRDCYGMRLHANELAQLTQRTAGWAAGLQMFHLATQGRSAAERGRVLAGPGLGIKFTREYLASNVLAVVPPELRRFLVRTAVFDELTPPRCDELLEVSGSAEHLAELERRGLFTFVEDDGRSYRYHEVLRTYLLEALGFEVGEEVARSLHRRAGAILEADGAPSGAVRAYSRGGAWDDVARLLGQQGEEIAGHPGSWIDLLPATIRQNDPWVLLAVARRLVASGSLDRARGIYRQVIEQLGTGADTAAAVELRLLESWCAPESGVRPTQWVQLLRHACAGFDGAVPELGGRGASDDLARGLAHLLRGELTSALSIFDAVLERTDASPTVEVGALLGQAIGLALRGDEDAPATAGRAEATAHRLGSGALNRVAAAVRLAIGPSSAPAVHLVDECARDDDAWGGAMVRLLTGVGRLGTGDDGAELQAAVAAFDQLGAPALAAWAAVAAQIATLESGGELAPEAARAVERQARTAGPLPYALALVASSHVESSDAGRERARTEAVSIGERCGALPLVLRALRAGRVDDETELPLVEEREPAPAEDAPSGRVTVHCLGRFSLERDGEALALDGLRPQPQTVLRVLALHANRTVHRERLADWVWAGRGTDRSGHNLQVAVSAIRKILDDGSLVRDGEGYRLELGSDDDSDVRRLEALVTSAARRAQAGDDAGAAADYERAVEGYQGELLPDAGPAEWVVDERARLAGLVTASLEWLSDHASEKGDAREAAAWARRGLELDRYRDGLWRRAIAATRAAGDPVAARSLEADYAALCEEMEVSIPG